MKDNINRAPKAREDSLCYGFALEEGSGHSCLVEEKHQRIGKWQGEEANQEKKTVGKICRKNISVLTTPDPWCLTSAAGGS